MIENEILDIRNPNHARWQFVFDELGFVAMERNIDEQFVIAALSRPKKHKDEPTILIGIDDFSAEPEMTKLIRLVNNLYTRGRHARI